MLTDSKNGMTKAPNIEIPNNDARNCYRNKISITFFELWDSIVIRIKRLFVHLEMEFKNQIITEI